MLGACPASSPASRLWLYPAYWGLSYVPPGLEDTYLGNPEGGLPSQARESGGAGAGEEKKGEGPGHKPG